MPSSPSCEVAIGTATLIAIVPGVDSDAPHADAVAGAGLDEIDFTFESEALAAAAEAALARNREIP
jgi:2-keto-3-deoxy-6-phosphogluconate aldolase